MDETLRVWIEAVDTRRGDLVLAGELVGGRVGDAIFHLMSWRWEEDTLVMEFRAAWSLSIVRPSAIELGYSGRRPFRDVLVIPNAAEVHLRRPSRTSGELRTVSYRFDGDFVTRTADEAMQSTWPSTTYLRRSEAVQFIP